MNPRRIAQLLAAIFLLGLPALATYMADGIITKERYDHYLLMILTGWTIGGVGVKNE